MNHCARYYYLVIYLFIHNLYPELCVVAPLLHNIHEHFTHTLLRTTVVRLYVTCEHHLPVIIESCKIS